MRMLLTSNGVNEPGPVQDAFLGLLGTPTAESRIAVVIDAMLPFPGDKGRMLDHLDGLRALGWAEFDVVSPFAGPRGLVESRLRGADVLFCYGGSNHWLSHAWNSSGLSPVLRELLDEKVYVGLSAGSMIFSRNQAAAVDAFDDREELELFGFDTVAPAVPLFDWVMLAHLGAPYFAAMTPEWTSERAARLGAPVWFLDNATALLVRDPDAEPEVVSGGHWLHFDGSGALLDSR
jgi:dipeptidase E